MSQSISPKARQESAGNSRQRSTMLSMVGLQYMTPRPVKIVKKILQKNEIAMKNKTEHSLSASGMKSSSNRQHQSSASGSKSCSKSKRNITMKNKQNSQMSSQQLQGKMNNQKENLNILMPMMTQTNNSLYQLQPQMLQNQALVNYLKTQTVPNSTKNATAQNFQPFFEQVAVKKLQKLSKNQLSQKQHTRQGSSKGKVKQRLGKFNGGGSVFNSSNGQGFIDNLMPDLAGDGTTSSARKIRIQSTLESPSSTKEVTQPFYNPKHHLMQRMAQNGASKGLTILTSQDLRTSQDQFNYGEGDMLQKSENLMSSQEKKGILQPQARNFSRHTQDSKEDNTGRLYQSQHESDFGLSTVTQRDFYKAAETLKKRSEQLKNLGGNYTLATTSIASAGDLQNSERHKLKIKPPKHSFNHLNTRQQHLTPQHNNLVSPGKGNGSQPKQQNYLSTLASKTQYNPASYLMNAQLLNKQKATQQSQKSRNGQFIMNGNSNWQTQPGHGFSDILMGSTSAQNLHATTASIPTTTGKNKSQNQIIMNPQFTNIHQTHDGVTKDKVLSSHQQIQAAVIKNFKYQNNFKLSFTNSFNHQNSLAEKVSPIKHGSSVEGEPLRTQQLTKDQKKQEQLRIEKQQKLTKISEDIDDALTSPISDNNSQAQSYLKALTEIGNLLDPEFKDTLTQLHLGFSSLIGSINSNNEGLTQELQASQQETQQKAEELSILQSDIVDIKLNADECQMSIQQMAQQIDERDDMIERLEYDLDHQRRKNRELFKQQMKMPAKKGAGDLMIQQTLGDETEQSVPMCDEELMNENAEMKNIVKELQEELDYGKQRENKLMFFLYILKEKGFPISEVFEEEIKDIPTTRFSTHFDDEYKTMYYQIRQERKHAKREAKLEKLDGGFGIQRDEIFALSPLTERVYSYVSRALPTQLQSNMKSGSNKDFERIPYIAESDMSDSNYVPVTIEKAKVRKRPSIVPKLNLMRMPQLSDSSSDSDEMDSQGRPKRGPNPRQLKKILDKYNIHTCARNIMLQEKLIRQRKNKKSLVDEIKINRSYVSSIKSSIVLLDQIPAEKPDKKRQPPK